MPKPLSFPIRGGLLLLFLQPCGAWADWKTPRENLDQRMAAGEIRIYYTLNGENAFLAETPAPKQMEKAKDVLEQLREQFEQSHRFYADHLGLIPPLKNKRYGSVRSIDVHILDLKRGMGSTGDAIVRYRYRHFDAPGPAITITLATRWRPPNSTPNHELFHAYQYGYTYFKTSWFLEGMARSMDDVFASRFPTETLPQNRPELQELMTRSYRANTFWNRVMQLCDPACKAGAAKTGGPRVCGGSIVRPLLEQYQSLDRVAAKDRGIDPDDWPEAEQRSDKNNPYLLLGLRRVLETHCSSRSNEELSRFHRLLGE